MLRRASSAKSVWVARADGSQASPFFVKIIDGITGQVSYKPNVGEIKAVGDTALQGAIDSAMPKGGVGSGAAGLFGKAAGMFLTGAFADGGPISGAGNYLVGERGPEILSLGGGSGYVTPNNKISSFGGATHNWDIDVDARGAHDPAAVRAQVMQGITEAAPHIVAASLAAGKDQRSRVPTSMRG